MAKIDIEDDLLGKPDDLMEAMEKIIAVGEWSSASSGLAGRSWTRDELYERQQPSRE